MRTLIDGADASIDWNGYHLLTSVVPLRDFLDLEEMSMVASDRKFAWDVFLQRHPEYLSKLRAKPRAQEPAPEPAREGSDRVMVRRKASVGRGRRKRGAG